MSLAVCPQCESPMTPANLATHLAGGYCDELAIRGRSLTADPMRCSMSTEAAPDIGEASDLEQLMARRLLNNR